MDLLACINTFICIVEEGNLHTAAIKLHQTDAAVSKKLSKLEEHLSVILLERKHGQSILTEVGQQYYALCKEATEKINSAKQYIQQVNVIPHGELKISCVKPNFQRYIMPKLKLFLKKYPEIRLTLNVSERVPDFSKGEADILFALAMPISEQENNLVRKSLGKTRDMICATPVYWNKFGYPKKPKDLLKLRYICHTARKPINLLTFDNDLELQIQPYLKIDDHDTIINTALQNIGFIFAKEYMIEEYIKSGKLVEVLPKYTKNQLSIYIYYRYQLYPDPKVRAFIDFFTKAE